jgi:ABC-type cobalamin/Fe3+-siderophores transport system ATPase subunit
MKDGGALAVGPPARALREELLSDLYRVKVTVRKVPYNGGETLVSLPGKRERERE